MFRLGILEDRHGKCLLSGMAFSPLKYCDALDALC